MYLFIMKRKTLLLAFLVIGSLSLHAQEKKNSIPLIGSQAPSFKAESTTGKLNFPNDFKNSWKIIFSHPKDFTPVCSSELLELAYNQKDFEAINTRIIVISTDVIGQHQTWIEALEEIADNNNRSVKIEFPLIADNSMDVSRKYGMLHEPVSTSESVRGVFIIDPENVIRSVQFYPMEIGRSIPEIKRSVLALQMITENNDVFTPANWEPGDPTLIPYLTKEDKKKIELSDPEIQHQSWFLNYRTASPK